MQTGAFHATPRQAISVAYVMGKIEVKILRDVAKNPSIVEIIKNGHKIKAFYDGDNLTLEGPTGILPSISEVLQIAYPYEIEQTSRPEWYDRNPKSIANEYENTLVPHAGTERLSYICPPDRKAMVEGLFMGNLRISAAAPEGWAGISWIITPKGGSDITLFSINWLDNNVGYRLEQPLGTTITLFPDDEITAWTTDLSTNGTIYHRISYKITEFDY